jgi:PTH1 family peptidyl-tRNA hydrolase
MKLIVGLGNPGEKYENTRHNIGFIALDQFLKDLESVNKTIWNDNAKFKSDIFEFEWQRTKPIDDGVVKQSLLEKVILAKPKTYMNDSGLAVQLIANFYKIPTEDIWVVHDDVDFPEGSMRIRQGGASAGHRGIMSIIDQLGDDKFWRFRLGIGRPGEAGHSGVAHHVLDEFSQQDYSKIKDMLKHASKAIALGLDKDLVSAMNRYNTK